MSVGHSKVYSGAHRHFAAAFCLLATCIMGHSASMALVMYLLLYERPCDAIIFLCIHDGLSDSAPPADSSIPHKSPQHLMPYIFTNHEAILLEKWYIIAVSRVYYEFSTKMDQRIPFCSRKNSNKLQGFFRKCCGESQCPYIVATEKLIECR